MSGGGRHGRLATHRRIPALGIVLIGGAAIAAGAAGPASAGAAAPTVVTVAGTGAPGFGGDGGSAAAARLDGPAGIAVDPAGDLFIADTGNCRVREVPATSGTHYGIAMAAHRIYTVAGAGCGGGRGSVGYPTGVAVDAAGDLFVADPTGNRVLELPAAGGERTLGAAARAGRLTTVAGTGAAGFSGDGGPATHARLDEPTGIAVDAAGNLFVADTENCRIREVPAGGGTSYGIAMQAHRIYTVAGTGVCGTTGLGGPALQAQLFTPTAVTLDASGDILMANRGTGKVLELAVAAGTYYGQAIGAGDVAVVAGTGTYSSYLVDGLSATGTTGELNFPYGLAVEPDGDLFVADTDEQAIREIPTVNGTSFDRSVSTGDIYTTIGAIPSGSNDDSTHWQIATVTAPYGLAFNAAGDLYYSDQGADVVREIRP